MNLGPKIDIQVGSPEYIARWYPYCCRYKERGVMFCHDGNDCKCSCHGTLAPPVK